VLAYLVEILSDQAFDAYLRETLFEPLGMVDTDFCVREGAGSIRGDVRFASHRSQRFDCHTMVMCAAEGANECLPRPEGSREAAPHSVFGGGNGLVSTAADYWRFALMLLRDGELEEMRILSRKTVELMTTNHLPPNLMPYEIQGMYSPGRGYGLGVEIVADLGQSQMGEPVGAYSWSGAASTHFWVDPENQLIAIQLAQLQSGGFYAIGGVFLT